MSVQSQIESLLRPAQALPGLDDDRTMLDAALRFGSEGGKRFRPWLLATVLARIDHSTSVDQSTIDRVGAAIELLHTAFVVHDDVIDNDDTRRGRSSVPGWFGARSPGNARDVFTRAGGILAGDLALVAAVRGVATSGAAPETVAGLLDLLDATMQDSAAGELADVRLSLSADVPSVAEALSVSELKTASYSFVLPMKAAAILAGAGSEVVDRVGAVGRHLGIAYQLRDDLWGAFGEQAATGKDPLGDLREGKRTPLVAHAATTPQWWRLTHLGAPDLGPAEAAQIRRALVDAGSVAFVEDLMARHLDDARSAAEPLGLATVVEELPCTWDVPAVLEGEGVA